MRWKACRIGRDAGRSAAAIVLGLGIASAAGAGVYVNEVLYDQSSGTQEFVELYCAAGPTDITGWTLSDLDEETFAFSRDDTRFPCAEPFTLQPGDRVVVWQGPGAAVCDGPVRHIYLDTGLFLQRGGDEIVLRAPDGSCRDYVGFEYGPAHDGPPPGCGWTGPNPDNGHVRGVSVSRLDGEPFIDRDEGRDWEASGATSTTGPTSPGVRNDALSPADGDFDGIPDDVDNCPTTANPSQIDADADGVGDACDACPDDPINDGDADGLCGDLDNCPYVHNPAQGDTDGDGIGDVCDLCVDDPDPAQANGDGDGFGDVCDPCPDDPRNDSDGDGLCAGADNCPNVANPDQADADGDGIGDACEMAHEGVFLNEVDYDQRGGSQEFVELYAATGPVDITGWTLSDQDGMTVRFDTTDPRFPCQEPFVLQPGEFAVIWQGSGASVCDGPVRHIHLDTDRFLTRGGDDLVLRAADGSCRDYVAFEYGAGVDGPPSDCPWSGNHPDNDGIRGISVARLDGAPFTDTDRGEDWVTSGDAGTKYPSSAGEPNDRTAPADMDGDGVLDPDDNCPFDSNTSQADADGDGAGDACDPCPADVLDDIDGDGLCADSDNCPAVSNPGQDDTDGDGLGDACDWCPLDPQNLDSDLDGPCDAEDNCPSIPNADQLDGDGDGAGNACDPCPADALDDADGDGHCADADNCPEAANPGQADIDGDGTGDACDPCPADALDDVDGDGHCADVDNCPATANPGQEDLDGDGTGDACDPCPADPDGDLDADGHCADVDNCPATANPGQEDTDGDGAGNVCDPCPADALDDADGDGHCADVDNCPATANPAQEDLDGDGTGDACDPCPADPDGDLDADGHCADVDNCPATANPGHEDRDGDGAGNVCDPCPADALDDADGDGHCADVDNCPAAANPSQEDTDGDGTGDACDPCPADALNDVDGDGHCADVDNCPATANPGQEDTDGDGTGDACEIAGAVFINEILYDQLSGTSEFVELFAAEGPADLTGWELTDRDLVSFTFDASDPRFPCPEPFLLNRGDFVVVWQGSGIAVCDGPVREFFLDSGYFLPRSGDDAVLRAADGACRDYIAYESETGGLPPPVDCTWHGPNPSNGNVRGTSISRIDGEPYVDSDSGLDWEMSGSGSTAGPDSPGSVNLSEAVVDSDGDGVEDAVDNCPGTPNPSQSDGEGDGVGDACDTCPFLPDPAQVDDDGDGQGNPCDPCPADPLDDADADGLCADVDNCPATANSAQGDVDGDAIGDACDPCIDDPLNDADGDAICGASDNCPGIANADQSDGDADGAGDPCDVCPSDPDPDQTDSDGDGVGDLCDPCPFDADDDLDGDGLCADVDNCPGVANPGQADLDIDGVGDPCDACPDDPANDPDVDGVCDGVDNCPGVFNADQADGDLDGAGDVCDVCPVIPDPAQIDSDGDGAGDPCDPCPLDRRDDHDGDGLCGDVDNCDFTVNTDQADADGDGTGDVCDNCPDTANPDQRDLDRDRNGDACDPCHEDPDDDGDGDGLCAEIDNCAAVANQSQSDADGDGVGDACDPCPGDTTNDRDEDGVCGGDDNCPYVPNAAQIDTDQNGVGDACDRTPLLDILETVPEGEWYRANLNRFEDVWAPPELQPLWRCCPSSPHKLIAAWGSFAWDRNRGDLWIYGGGNANSSANDVYRWRAVTRRWERASYPSEVATNPITEYLEPVDGMDAAPLSAHTYDNNIFLPLVDRFLTFGGAATSTFGSYFREDETDPGETRRTGPYLFDPHRADGDKVGGTTGSHVQRDQPHPEIVGGKMWDNRDSYQFSWPYRGIPASHIAGATAHTVVNGVDVVYVSAASHGTSKALYRYTVHDVERSSQDTWEHVGRYWNGTAGHGPGALDPDLDVFVRIEGDIFVYWSLDNPGPENDDVPFVPDDASGEFVLDASFGMDFDPVRKQFVLWSGSGTVWALEAPDPISPFGWTIVRQPTPQSATPNGDAGTGILGKWEYAPDLDAFVGLQDAYAGNVWIYKPIGWQRPAP